MRWGLLVFAVGCAAAAPAAEPPREPANLMDSETFATRISGLRATLARSDIAIDTDPVLETCAGDHHGPASRCMRCDVATRENTGGVDPSLIDGVALAFAAYPPAFLDAAKLEHVALCRSIRWQDGDKRPPAGVAISDQRRLMISVEYFVDGSPLYEDFTISQVVHHEVFHLFDRATSGAKSDREWATLNPRGFEYRDPAVSAATRPAGFVNTYATTNELEDRATVFEYLLGQPRRLCEIADEDPVVAAKVAAVWRRVARVVGVKLLRQHAPCVDWIGKKKERKPAKRAVRLQIAPP
ncbi:MAG: hypothetical protein SFX73_20385 [Kofleriaceae bacterium]|nr:hypothetical protein [Kofleriaceae bacterium]